jgi:hypothetical protein
MFYLILFVSIGSILFKRGEPHIDPEVLPRAFRPPPLKSGFGRRR